MRLTVSAARLPVQFIQELGIDAALTSVSVKRGDNPPLRFVFDSGRGDGLATEIDPVGKTLESFIFSGKQSGHLHGDHTVSNWNGASYAWTKTNGLTFADGVLHSSPAAESATAQFTAADVGRPVSAAGLPADTTIAAVIDGSHITLSQAATATATGVTLTIAGRTPVYEIAPSFNVVELNDLLVDGTIAAKPADQAARYALAGLALGTIVRQLDNQTYWKVIDIAHLADAAGWSTDVPQKDAVDLTMELECVVSGSRFSTQRVILHIENDQIIGTEGVPVSANPSYPAPSEIQRIAWLYKPWDATPYVAASGDQILADTTIGQFSMKLPADPDVGDAVTFADAQGTFATGNLVILRNGQLIDGAAENLTLDAANACVQFVFAGGAKGWQVFRLS